MFCTKCGRELKPDSKFCPGCGNKVKPKNEEASEIADVAVESTETATETAEEPAVMQQPVEPVQQPLYTEQFEVPAEEEVAPVQLKKPRMGVMTKVAIMSVLAVVIVAAALVVLMKTGKVDAHKYLPDSIASLIADDQKDKEDSGEEANIDKSVEEEAVSEVKDTEEVEEEADKPEKKEKTKKEKKNKKEESEDDEMVSLGGRDDEDEMTSLDEREAEDKEKQKEEEFVEPDFLIPDSSEREITEKDLAGMGAWECRVARNEIYARHGRRFKDEQLQAYFDGKDWYKGTIDPDSFKESKLSLIERTNADFIDRYEKKNGYK